MHLAVGKGSGSIDVLICDISTVANKYDEISSYGAHDHIVSFYFHVDKSFHLMTMIYYGILNQVTGLAWAFDGCCLYSCSQVFLFLRTLVVWML